MKCALVYSLKILFKFFFSYALIQFGWILSISGWLTAILPSIRFCTQSSIKNSDWHSKKLLLDKYSANAVHNIIVCEYLNSIL